MKMIVKLALLGGVSRASLGFFGCPEPVSEIEINFEEFGGRWYMIQRDSLEESLSL